jgi:hypothetical protein
MKFIFIALVFSTTLFAKDFTFDQESGKAVPNHLGEIKLLKGKVFKKHQGKTTEVKTGTRFNKDDTVFTEQRSFAKISLVDDTILTVGPNSELNFSEFKYVDKTNRQITFDFIKGQLRALVVNKAKEGDLKFRTKAALMGVRGTELLINHQTLNALEISEFALLTGSAEVMDNKNEKHALAKLDRITIVLDSDNRKIASHKNTLSETEQNLLKAEEGLMPYFQIENLSKTSALYSHLQKLPVSDLSSGQSNQAPVNQDERKNWRYNLQKLNEKLKLNQKR